MVNAQEWLDKNYPKIKEPRVINAQKENLEGSLVVEGYKKLKTVNCYRNDKLESVKLKDLPKLNTFSAHRCQIKNFEINNCPNINTLRLGDNQLENTEFLSSLNPEELSYLSIYSNDFKKQTLDFLSKFVNLKYLAIGNRNKDKVEKGICNRFYGSLEPLKNMRNLFLLSIVNTDIDSGLEYLSKSVKRIGCNNDNWKDLHGKDRNWNCSNILKELKKVSRLPGVTKDLKYEDEEIDDEGALLELDFYNFDSWWQASSELLVKEIGKLEKEKEELWKRIYPNSEKRKNLLSSSQDYQELTEEINKIKEELEAKSKEIKRLSEGIEKLKKRDKTRVQNLHGWIKKDKQDLEKEKKECTRNLEKNVKDEIELNPNYAKDKIEEILEIQTEINTSNSITASEKKKSVLATIPKAKDILIKIERICNLKTQIIEKEKEMEDIKNISLKVIDIEEGRSKEKEKTNVMIAPIMPSQWNKLKEERTLEENYDKKKDYRYKEIYSEKPSSWEIRRNKPLTLEELPIRLYDTTGKFDEENPQKNIKRKEECGDIQNYAMLSYMWGNKKSEKALSSGGKKSLLKAIETCRHLGIKYLWMDQLCIDQNNPKEKSQEIPKMRQYYANSDVTLISIHTDLRDEKTNQLPTLPDILKLVIKSDWFKRSWTFQEGWLSKQTIFMFDDVLVDGRAMASIWALHQPSYTEYGKYENFNEFYEGTKKIATPLGWVYYKDRYSPEDTVSLRLYEALREMKKRKRSLSIDGIYSILGLLPYGKQVEVKYKEWGYEYTELELQEALLNVMREAVKFGHGEHLAWHGIGSGWMPEISEDGSTSVAGGVKVNYKESNYEISHAFTKDGIELTATKYIIKSVYPEINGIEESEGFMVESGAHIKKVIVEVSNRREEITLLGTRETLEKVEINDALLVLSEKEWESNKPFAVLATRESDVYNRKGLVEFLLKSDAQKLKGEKEKKIIIAMNNDSQGNRKSESQETSKSEQKETVQIEIPPK
ncbi:MAG: HET domain-containing protein [Candidatus Moeniiplasma glomeromycotorum]|nr:HET domain-containing protein [Candidatus Moeniiplasma glomeromycotorum]MCE8169530.1 HET domain-containing protein [Candidatus Moeniiplasma glomeromycotorum]